MWRKDRRGARIETKTPDTGPGYWNHPIIQRDHGLGCSSGGEKY